MFYFDAIKVEIFYLDMCSAICQESKKKVYFSQFIICSISGLH